MFLERKSYRRRRMMDAWRLVAILGVVLWLIPVIWPTGPEIGAQTLEMSRALYYVFGVWITLILLTLVLHRLLRGKPAEQTENLDDTDGGP
ncbi:MAG: hypothetical protein ABJ360_19880 [Roseobacter sp.]